MFVTVSIARALMAPETNQNTVVKRGRGASIARTTNQTGYGGERNEEAIVTEGGFATSVTESSSSNSRSLSSRVWHPFTHFASHFALVLESSISFYSTDKAKIPKNRSP